MPVGAQAACVGGSIKMSGTTLCPHCDTRFKIVETQLEAHHGMVRCGSCLKAFDARPGFVPDQPSPQMELLPVLNEQVAQTVALPADEPQIAETAPAVNEQAPAEEAPSAEEVTSGDKEAVAGATGLPEAVSSEIEGDAAAEPQAAPPPSELEVLQPITLAEQVAIVPDEEGTETQQGYRNLNWVIGSALLVLVLFMQAAYFFRVELAASTPGLKPALTGYGKMFGGSVPLPQDASLMSIESSDLEADPAHENRIILSVLLRNRAAYAQAFPNLELTLNDAQDSPLARRTLVPKDYLPSVENEKTGMQPNHELSVKLELGITDLKPSGYRLALHYAKQ